MKKIIKQTTYVEIVGEINNSPSETVPDQALTPQELLETYARGAIMPQTFFDEENDWNLKGLDLTEIDELREQYQEQQLEAKKALGELEKKRLQLIKEREESLYKNKNTVDSNEGGGVSGET